MSNPLKIEHGGHTLELLSDGAIRWGTTLLVADLHLGKETAFQKSGIAIPRGATRGTFDRLDTLIARWGDPCNRMVILGDLLHAPAGWNDELQSDLSNLLKRHRKLEWLLVAGNHDRRSHTRLRELGWVVQEGDVVEGSMRWIHDPSDLLGEGAKSGLVGSTLAGHIHPSFRVPIDAKRTTRTPCFWIRNNLIVLPAFGGWVGTHPIEPTRGDRIILCVEGQLIEWKWATTRNIT